MERPYTIDDLKALSPDLVNELFSILKTMKITVEDNQSQQIAIWSIRDHCCPFCGCEDYVKNGHQKNGAQKFVCKGCGRSFSMDTKTSGENSRFNLEKWTAFIECELNGMSSRKTAAMIGINRNTALLWRHKLYSALDYIQNSKLSGQIQIDAKNIPINFKGQNYKTMPRSSKRRKSNRSASKNNHSSCIVSAIDDQDHIVLKVAGFGKETKEMYSVLNGQVEPGSTVIGDGFWGFGKLCEHWNCNLETVKAECHVNEHGFSLSDINQIHSELESFFVRYHGISTRHLQGYLNMFILRKQLNYRFDPQFHSREAWVSMIPKQTSVTRRTENSIPYPFDIWAAYHDYLLPAVPYQLNGVA